MPFPLPSRQMMASVFGQRYSRLMVRPGLLLYRGDPTAGTCEAIARVPVGNRVKEYTIDCRVEKGSLIMRGDVQQRRK